MLAGFENYLNPVSKGVGINTAPAYGLAIQDANHLTPVNGLKWSPTEMLASWQYIWQLPYNVLHELTAPDDQQALQDLAEVIDELLASMFGSNGNQGAEENRTRTFREYTLAFWDAHLSEDYDPAAAFAFLQQDEAIHEASTYVEDYQISHPTQVFWVRDENDAPLVQFQDDGNTLVLKGQFSEQQIISWGTDTSDFVVLNAAGTLTAKVVGNTGDFLIHGETGPSNQSVVSLTNTAEFGIQSARDSSDQAQIVIDANGDMKARGGTYSRYNLQP